MSHLYTGYELTEQSRRKLLERFPPKYSTVLGHHITLQFAVPVGSEEPSAPQSVKVVGYANDGEKIEGLLCQVDGKLERSDGKYFHITWSLDKSKGAKPVDTNNILKKASLVVPIEIDVTPKLFDRSTESYIK